MNISKDALMEKTLLLLEYPKIMERVSEYALSAEAAEIIKNSKPVMDNSAEEVKEKVSAIHFALTTCSDEPRSFLPAIGFLFPKLETEGAVLELDEALAIGLFMEQGTQLTGWIKKNINTYNDSLYDCSNIAAEIFKIIDREGKIRDLPVLRAIRKRIENLEKEIKASISGYLTDEESKKALQSFLPSQRDGRAVLAVKSNFRGRIRGIVHEASSSGQTVFIEPLDVVEKNNELLLEKHNFDAEIHKILRELTKKISVYSEELKSFHAKIIKLECLRTKAKYSAAIKGCFAKNSSLCGESLCLKQARHPLLKKAVPIDIMMEKNIRTLIITGPNTGGKTVALKTLGLFALMNQSGLALPLAEGSCLPVFDGIYADIGDEQSIDQSLSTFSAHITNISAIVFYATENSLVLLDELGSGTDPEEGTAIAMAVLDYLIEKKSQMVITTHHGVLKNYGFTNEGVENASVEFDAHTLSPTYRIINGIPGESRALEIADANGLDKAIIKKAGNYIDKKKSDISSIIKGLEQKQRELAGMEKKSVMERAKLKEERRKADLKELQLRQKETELKREYIGKLKNLLAESRKTLENLVRELKEGEITREKTLKVKEFLNEFSRNIDIERDALNEEERLITNHRLKEQFREIKTTAVFRSGTEVLAGASKQRGVIVRAGKKNSAGNSWVVEIGSIKLNFPEKELIPVIVKNTVSNTSWDADYSSSGNSAVYELKLLGMRLDEATDALRRQIEAASLSGLKNFAVIHGKGSGVLQKGIHEYLKKEPAVADYFFARPELGGFGRTEVVLK